MIKSFFYILYDLVVKFLEVNILANVIVNDVVFKTILNSNCEYVREAI